MREKDVTHTHKHKHTREREREIIRTTGIPFLNSSTKKDGFSLLGLGHCTTAAVVQIHDWGYSGDRAWTEQEKKNEEKRELPLTLAQTGLLFQSSCQHDRVSLRVFAVPSCCEVLH